MRIILYLVTEVLAIIINSFSKSLSAKYVSSTGDTTVNKTDKNNYPYDIGVPVTSCSGHIIFPDNNDGGDDNYSR